MDIDEYTIQGNHNSKLLLDIRDFSFSGSSVSVVVGSLSSSSFISLGGRDFFPSTMSALSHLGMDEELGEITKVDDAGLKKSFAGT